jgi:hypothetical protein
VGAPRRLESLKSLTWVGAASPRTTALMSELESRDSLLALEGSHKSLTVYEHEEVDLASAFKVTSIRKSEPG